MTRTGVTSKLLAHRQEPFVEVHPEDAAQWHLAEGGLAELTGDQGVYCGRVRLTSNQRRGEVFVPIHWNRQFSANSLASSLIAPVTDPISGQPESKHGRCSVRPFKQSWSARLMVRANHSVRWEAPYWAFVPMENCNSWILAGRQPLQWPLMLEDWLGGEPQLVMSDPHAGRYRAALIKDGRLQAVLMVEREASALPDMAYLDACFQQDELTDSVRRTLLAAKEPGAEEVGVTVCTCFQVGSVQIEAAMAKGCMTVDALGKALSCGTCCGSCIPELQAMIAESGRKSA